MACPLCGDRCTCSATGNEFAGEHTAVLIDPDSNYSSEMSEQQFAASLHSATPPPRSNSSSRLAIGQAATATADPAFYRPATNDPNHQDGSAWRDEISQRVQAHKARRRRRFDPDASLGFSFEPETSNSPAAQTDSADEEQTATPKAPRMYRRIALEMEATAAREAYAAAVASEATEVSEAAAVEPETNIIEFPRSAAPIATEDLFAHELAEPMLESPRILDVPEESMPPLAASSASLSSLRLDEGLENDSPKEIPEWIRNYRDEYDEAELELPLQAASLRPRFMSAVIDTALVLTATAVFCVIVLSITKFMPQGKPGLLAVIGLIATFWLAYHYAFLVYSGVTPGMQVAQLELCSFEGCYPLRSTRGARALAMGVSCMSLGMGFAWAAVDEDGLGWHDRITRTYLRQS
ncbi:MAG: RDD family protein [Terriglobales bacterium]